MSKWGSEGVRKRRREEGREGEGEAGRNDVSERVRKGEGVSESE